MRKFEFILAEFGLLEDAMVVSRQESSPAMIEEARISTLPILVSSPLFALGINFVVPPVVLWTYFSYLHVDESQIIQTLNRANRGSVRCEVRLYHGELDTTPVSIPDAEKEKMRIAGYLLDEATMQGVLDAHYQIDRVTYLSLREAEKQTPKSFYSLIERDGFQNYQIHYEWVNDIETTKEDDDLFDDIARGARESYLNDVEVQALRYSNHTYSLLLYQLERLYQEKKQWADEERILRDIENKQRGVCMLICGVSPKVSANVKPARLRRLFADLQPYMTAQYSHEKTGEWRTVAAEKTLAMIPLLEHLKRMKADNLGGITFAALMNRPMRGAVKALADNEDNLISWQKKLERLDAIAFQIRNSASKAQRPHLNAERFEIAEEFLATIGVTFEKVKDWDTGRLVTDPSQPKVPNWDFEAMIVELQRAAESLKRLPEKPVDKNWENEHWFGAAVSHQLCALCVHCDQDFICALGRPIQPEWDDIDPTTDKCDAFHKLPAKLIPKEPTKK
jgi:hypothetical protein